MSRAEADSGPSMGIRATAIEHPAEAGLEPTPDPVLDLALDPAATAETTLDAPGGAARATVASAAEAEPALAQANLAARRRAQQWGMAGLALLALTGLVAWQWGGPIVHLLSDERAIEALVQRAGIWGPLAIIACNILQIVIAPIPGYVVQLAAGYLYGPLWGGVIAAIGTLSGAMLSMLAARTFGRSLAIWLLGPERIARWEKVTHSDSAWVWLLLMAAPVGDSVYLLAGLSRITWLTIFVCTLIVRIPSVFLSTAIGGGALPAVWTLVALIVFGTLAAVAWRFRARITDWFERAARNRALRSSLHGEPGEPLLVTAEDPNPEQPRIR